MDEFNEETIMLNLAMMMKEELTNKVICETKIQITTKNGKTYSIMVERGV